MELVKYATEDRICWITINRPEKRNALNSQVVTELKAAFKKAEADDQVKVVVLTGEGDVFCAGADLEYLQKLQNNTYEENLSDSKNLMELYYQIYTLKKVVVAQVNGHAVAGGCGLVSVCDFAYAVREANFGYTEVRIGFIPAIVSVFLVKKIGEARSREMLLSGEIYTSKTALQYGLINHVVEDEDLSTVVRDFCEKLVVNNSLSSMELTKKMLADIFAMDVKEALNYAAESNARARSTDDCKKGIASFLNKEKPIW
jgi:methylglutaconyl-CoA hydratase